MTTLPGPWQGRGSPHHPWPVLAPPQGVWIADDECGSVGKRGREISTMPSAVLQQKDTHTVESCNYLKMWHVYNTHARLTFHVLQVWGSLVPHGSWTQHWAPLSGASLWTLNPKQKIDDKLWTVLRMKFLLHAPRQTKCELKTAPERTFNLQYLDH